MFPSKSPKVNEIFLIALFCIFQLGCTSPLRNVSKTYTKPYRDIKSLRVILDDSKQAKELHFDCKVLLRSDRKNITEIKAGESIQLSCKKNQVEIRTKKMKYSLESVDIYPVGESDLLNYKNRYYRGVFRIKPNGNKILLVNVLGVEDYLKGAIYSEMGPANKLSDFEALKAFAVCLRNYTYMKISENKEEFDLYPDSRDQVYLGASGEKDFSNKAIDETNDLVLEYNGSLAKTFYHSSCGGHTENSDNVFSEKGLEYLSGVQDGETAYCKISPGFNWSESYSAKEIISMLRKAKYLDNDSYEINKIEVKSRFASGRANQLKITVENKDGKIKDLFLVGNYIRNVFLSKQGKGILKSTLFEIETEYKNDHIYSLKFIGKGNGHGVGFCQWGAISQSRSGKKFDEILYFYFPGTRLSEF